MIIFKNEPECHVPEFHSLFPCNHTWSFVCRNFMMERLKQFLCCCLTEDVQNMLPKCWRLLLHFSASLCRVVSRSFSDAVSRVAEQRKGRIMSSYVTFPCHSSDSSRILTDQCGSYTSTWRLPSRDPAGRGSLFLLYRLGIGCRSFWAQRVLPTCFSSQEKTACCLFLPQADLVTS